METSSIKFLINRAHKLENDLKVMVKRYKKLNKVNKKLQEENRILKSKLRKQ